MQFEATYIQQFHPKRGLVFTPELIVDGVKTAIQGAQQFDSIDAAIAEAKLVIQRHIDAKNPVNEKIKSTPNYNEPNENALANLKVKMEAVRDSFDDMTDEQYGDWLDSLEFDEFIELIRLIEK
ncbi:hypothetical protein [Vibrio anguillarum]|uniref:Phage protein n=1 Tax=Vibrio anguillarum TaxID=55601 RepID=A0ABR9Z945_VIBAN|nr:hypothetical protein [Vibrio anguillarum]MBF4374969.1 hypothetical protein [Vibrio anguillarum]